MATVQKKPRSGQPLDSPHYTELINHYLDSGHSTHRSDDFYSASAHNAYDDLLANTSRATVTLMRVPFAPYFDTKFILKLFKTAYFAQAPVEQAELEAASLHHAAEAFRRNNNISRAPRVYVIRADQNYIAQECIPGRGFRDSYPQWWPKERLIKFVRQVAVARLALLSQVENQLGAPRHAPDGRRVGPYCSGVWWENARHRFWNQINRGPFLNRHELILASLRKELLVIRWMRDRHEVLHSSSHFHTWEDAISYLEATIRNIDQVPRPTNQEFFSLNHGDLRDGFNIMMRGSKLVGIIDWEAAAYAPLPICIMDLTNSTDYNPREWRAHAGPNGENFHVLPYRLETENMEGRLERLTRDGAERKPFPDWELIENNGGPLGEEDFYGDDYPEDISSADDESIIDAAEMHCDSDAEAEESCVLPEDPEVPESQRLSENQRRGLAPYELPEDWYYEPVYALMREFIHHQRGAGLGPNGEWGRLPEAYSRPLAEWEDTLYIRATRRYFDLHHSQIIDEDRADAEPRLAKGPRGKKSKKQPRQRRVPTLMDGWRDAAAAGTEIPPESPESSGDSWAKDRAPQRIRLNPPPKPRRVGPNPDPIPVSTLQKEQALKRVKQRGKADPPPVKLPPAGARVRGVRDRIAAKVMEKLRDRLGRGADVL
ncbi:hypothetical protein B9Z19DRAFT_1119254 [Tuber borchii]|uniref:Aminoglycoside phosphotransferase domain-containing protein n=1 Tax=Tuber borchii TaxID=42251 RepID=A0A2T7A6S1_TUBBO|nr:hypothetical protein B9Z19DRAFT_1119254 [Tuber borchii]